jgi:hypothetical protein
MPWESIWEILSVMRKKCQQNKEQSQKIRYFKHPYAKFSDTELSASDQQNFRTKLTKVGLKEMKAE